MSRYSHILRCECGQLARHQTPTGKCCDRYHRIQQMFAEGAECERWHNGICGVRDRADYDGMTRREWRTGGWE